VIAFAGFASAGFGVILPEGEQALEMPIG